MSNKNTQEVKLEKKFSLIELLMILMIVGIFFSFVIPLRQDAKNHEMVKEAIRDMQIIIRANVEFKNDPNNGYWAFDLGQLNIDHKLNQNYFFYTLSDTTVTAISTDNFAVDGATISYYLPNGPWTAGEDDLTRSVINPNWLP